MRKAISGIALAVLGFMFVVLTAGSSNATVADDGDVNGVTIGTIGYNARGNDTFLNRNKEYVNIVRDSGAVGDVVLNGLVIEDRWAHENTTDSTCNTYTVTDVTLKVGQTLRVYMGYGKSAETATYVTRFMDSKCGYHGHIFNNLGDTVFISKDGDTEKKSYDYENGYYV